MDQQPQDPKQETPVIPGEAPASLNFYGVTKAGWNVQFTLRDTDEDELMHRFARFVTQLAQWNVMPKPVGQQPTPAANGNSAPPPPAPAHNVPAPVANAVPPVAQPTSELSFGANQLTASINDGKTYWKVKGGRFGKYGVTVWPEVLAAAGFNVDQMNPAQAYDVTNFTAWYLEEGGKATKVTQLVRNGS